MYDSVTVSQIPKNAPAVAGYVGGRFPTYPVLVKSFPKAKKLSIAVMASENADCLDVETGDATIAEAPAWVKRQKARGLVKPVVYSSLSEAQSLVNALAKAGIGRTQYRLWVAHYTGKQHFCGPACGFGLTTRADATQWRNSAQDPLKRNLDTSVCSASFFT